MILGAGLFQLPAIKKAKKLGYCVITVDHTPDNPGHQYSHHYVNCSTVDKIGVLRAAKELQIDGICTFASDVAIPAVGYVCDALGLNGPSLQVAETFSQKHLFRAFLKQHDQLCPDYMVGSSFSEVESFIAERDNEGRKFLAKPVDTSGSRGVSMFYASQKNQAERSFEFAKQFSRSGLVCVEEFIEGEEVGGDGLLRNGKFEFIAITHKHLEGFIVQGHSLPPNLDPVDRARVIGALEDTCARLGYSNGPLNFDVMVSPSAIHIIEMSPRNGGNGLPAVIQRHYGVDLELMTLQMAVGDTLVIPKINDDPSSCGSLVIGSSKAGILDSITDLETLRSSLSGVYELTCTAHSGDAISALDHNGNSLGYVLFESEDYEEAVAAINQSLQIKLRPSDQC